jgi:hypothetical protein
MQLARADDVVPPGVRSQPSPLSGVANRDHRAQLIAGRKPEPGPLLVPAMPFRQPTFAKTPQDGAGPGSGSGRGRASGLSYG